MKIVNTEMIMQERHMAFLKRIGSPVLNPYTDDDIVQLEDTVSTYLLTKGFDAEYEPTPDGVLCEEILDIIGEY